MRLFRNSEVIGIAESALTFALEASRDSHPNEYMGLLRGEDAGFASHITWIMQEEARSRAKS